VDTLPYLGNYKGQSNNDDDANDDYNADADGTHKNLNSCTPTHSAFPTFPQHLGKSNL